MTQPWVVHIGAGTWQSSAIQVVRSLGFKTLAVDGSSEAVGFELADQSLVADIRKIDAVEATVSKFFSARSATLVAVVCTACEVGMLSAASLRDTHGLPGTGLELARRLTNKGEQRRAWRQLASPKYVVLTNEFSEIGSQLAEFRTERVIIKPIDSSGSRGISVIGRSYLAPEHIERARAFSSTGEIIIEEFVEGREYTVESIRLAGRSYPILVTHKNKVAGTNATVANLLKTATLSSAQGDQIRQLVEAAHDALGYDNGVCHTELIEDLSGRFWLVETAGRGAGFGVSEHFIKYASGYDYFEASIRLDLGMNVAPPDHGLPSMISAVRFLESVPGQLVAIKNESDIFIRQLLPEGAIMSTPKCDGDRVGYFYVNGESSDVVDSKIDEVLSKISIEVN